MTRSITLAILAGTVVFVFFGCAVIPRWREIERLVHSGTKTVGRVLAKDASQHRSVRYEYFVESRVYQGSSSAGFGGLPPFSEIKIGDQIPVTYWPARPSVSLPGDPADLYSSWSVLLFGVLPMVSILAGATVAFRLRKISIKKTTEQIVAHQPA